jgi:DNA modification methylase
LAEKVVIGNATLYLGDCLEVMPTLGTVDAVVTDPPYGVGFKGEGWDGSVPFEWLGLARSVSKRVVFTTAPLTLWDYPAPDWLAVCARPGATARTAQGGFNHYIAVMVYGVKFSVDMRYMPPVANLAAREYELGFAHPSPKPLQLMKWLVDESSSKGEVVCDPFMGSGTTGVACSQEGREFVGIEREPKYFELACRRIEQAQRQESLFPAEPAPKAEQLEII